MCEREWLDELVGTDWLKIVLTGKENLLLAGLMVSDLCHRSEKVTGWHSADVCSVCGYVCLGCVYVCACDVCARKSGKVSWCVEMTVVGARWTWVWRLCCLCFPTCKHCFENLAILPLRE